MTVSARKAPPLPMTTAEFLKWNGDGTAKRYQLVDGVVRAMAPASVTHAIIQATLASLVRQHLTASQSPCRVATEAAIVPSVGAETNLRVPDLAVTCRPDAPGQIALADPVLVIEILSPGNQAETRANLHAYASIPSVQEILLIHSTRIGAEIWRRNADSTWPEMPEEIPADTGKAATLRLTSIGLACPLAEVYAGTHLG